jgi:hypothetical protein
MKQGRYKFTMCSLCEIHTDVAKWRNYIPIYRLSKVIRDFEEISA